MTSELRAARPNDGAAALTEAHQAIAAGELDRAIALLTEALESAGNDAYDIDLRFNLAAALCQRAQGITDDAAAIANLDRATGLFNEVIEALPSATPRWASAKANLAIALVTRARRSGTRADVLMAHLSLDSAESVFRREDDAAGIDWVRAIRDHLTELHERRGATR